MWKFLINTLTSFLSAYDKGRCIDSFRSCKSKVSEKDEPFNMKIRHFTCENIVCEQVMFFSRVIIIKFDQLGSTYESNMENAMMMPLTIIIGWALQQHDA